MSPPDANSRGRRRLIVGISGATGIVYAERALTRLRAADVETHLVVSRAGELTRQYESGLSRAELHALADVVHPIHDFAASISSGSFVTDGMMIVPCSVRSLAEVASGVTTTLLTRAADVVLKERRRLVLVVRETPLHLGHIRNMAAVTEMGAIVMPPAPAFYLRPASLDEVIDHTVDRLLELFDIPGTGPRWA